MQGLSMGFQWALKITSAARLASSAANDAVGATCSTTQYGY
jgi:hypothetical protein